MKKKVYLFEDGDGERFYAKCDTPAKVGFAEEAYFAKAIAGPLPDKYELVNPYSITVVDGKIFKSTEI